MNRTEIDQKCIGRGVGGAADVGAVSQLFYVYLLNALQRGQSVDVPGFGTFGTRLAGTKKVRKVPYFEPSPALAEKANERFKDLEYFIVGEYDLHPVVAGKTLESVYPLQEPPAGRIGEEEIVDADSEVNADEFLQLTIADKSPQSSKEEIVMPRLNLKDDALDGDSGSLDSDKNIAPPPTLRDVGGSNGRSSPLLLIVLIIFVLAAGVFALNYFKVIHLWGKKVPKVAEVLPTDPGSTLPELESPANTDQGGTPATEPGAESNPLPATSAATQEPTPASVPTPSTIPATTTPVTTTPAATTPSAKPKRVLAPPPTGSGDFSIQVSSWTNKAKAEEEASKLSAAGFSAFVEEAAVGGETWHRVRVGRYASAQEAQEAASQVQKVVENVVWVAKGRH